jgi:hypothetical protein
VKARALVCRYCGFVFPAQAGVEPNPKGNFNKAAVAISVAMAVAAAGIAYLAMQSFSGMKRGTVAADAVESRSPIIQTERELYERLEAGATMEWTAETALPEIIRSVGPYTVRITKKVADEGIAPLVTVSGRGQAVTLEGFALSPTYTHYISAVRNRTRSAPIVMLQSFSGGAHCCNHVQLAGFSKGLLVRVELGSWDGDSIDPPKDISGDGIADFVLSDDSFLYAFAAYAMSYAPPVVLNVTNGKVVDVSKNPAFRKLYRDAIEDAGRTCRSGEDGMARNGACPAYVASAARLGKLSEAWTHMLSSYDASTGWDFPTACLVDDSSGCPDKSRVQFKSYPEALLNFLQEQGYVPRGWQPPEARRDITPAESETYEGPIA